jgi:hypothetical protein
LNTWCVTSKSPADSHQTLTRLSGECRYVIITWRK